MCSVARVAVAVAGVLSLVSAALQGQRLMELEGIQLRGSARVVAYGAATCEIREGFAGDDKAYDPANRGQPLDVWQLDFSVYNGSGKALDHLIARYNIASEWPPCSSWDGPSAGTVDGTVEWSDTSGLIQESGVVEPGQTLTATTYLVVFHSDEPPQFARWSMDYEFAASPPAGGAGSETARQTTGAPSEPARAGRRFQPEETCAGKEVGSSCWMELENQPGCYLWNGGLAENATVTWSGDCSAGLAQGTGSRTWSYTRDDGKPFSYTSTGELRDGKENGHWTLRFADGDVHEGPYVDGKPERPLDPAIRRRGRARRPLRGRQAKRPLDPAIRRRGRARRPLRGRQAKRPLDPAIRRRGRARRPLRGRREGRPLDLSRC